MRNAMGFALRPELGGDWLPPYTKVLLGRYILPIKVLLCHYLIDVERGEIFLDYFFCWQGLMPRRILHLRMEASKKPMRLSAGLHTEIPALRSFRALR